MNYFCIFRSRFLAVFCQRERFKPSEKRIETIDDYKFFLQKNEKICKNTNILIDTSINV